MLDPTIVFDLQRAVSLPAFTPPAVVRAWKSPLAERAERAAAPIVEDAERQTHAWRMKVMELEAALPTAAQQAWGEEDLAHMDSTIRVGEWTVQQHARRVRRDYEGALKFNGRLARRDRSAAAAHLRQSTRLRDVQLGNIDILNALVGRLRDLRARVDTRSGAGSGFVWRSWRPNAETLAALSDAEAGHTTAVSLDDLRAAILADD